MTDYEHAIYKLTNTYFDATKTSRNTNNTRPDDG